jgi:protein involved in polysaccharide export with SLBB domain
MAALWAAFLVGAMVPQAGAQEAPADTAIVNRLMVSRDTLQAILQRLTAEDSSGQSSPARQALAQQIRDRLEQGDFRAGDRIRLAVDSEPQLSDTFPVGPSQEVVLPVIGVISLHGVLRMELQSAMVEKLGRFLRDPIVRATPLIRVSVIGEVNKPGFYLLPPTYVVSDVITAGGGPTQDARVDKMRVERGGRRLLEGQPLQDLIAEGRTLDDAGIRPGDKFVIPALNRNNALDTVRIVSIVLSIPLTIYALIQVFKK